MNSETTLIETLHALNQQEASNEILLSTAQQLKALGTLYMMQGVTEKATASFVECINVHHQLAARDAAAYLQLKDDAVAEIAILYTSKELADHFPTAILDLAQSTPRISDPVLYGALTHLGKAGNIHYLISALHGYRQLAAANPDLYNPQLAYTIRAIGDLKYLETDLTTAEKYYQEAANIYEASLSEEAFLYYEDLATLLQKLAELKLRKDLPQIAMDDFIHSSTLLEILAEANPDKYMVPLARIYYKCAKLLHNEFRNDAKATYYLEKSVAAWEQVAANSQLTYQPETIQAKQALAKLTEKDAFHSSQIFIH